MTETLTVNWLITMKSELIVDQWDNPFWYVRKIFRKTKISYLLICTRTCVYQGVRNVSFSENFACYKMDDPNLQNMFSIKRESTQRYA